MSALLTSPLNLVPTQPEYRVFRLRCRFVVDAFHTEAQFERERLKAAYAFMHELERTGWASADGRLGVTGGPFPATVVSSGVPDVPRRAPVEHGPHARVGPAYVSPVLEIPTLLNVSDWEYEISGLFVRKMMPTVATVSAIEQLEAKRRSRRRG